MTTYDVAASADNSSYMAWQAMLFCFSALSRLNTFPTIVVHKDEQDTLRNEFVLLRKFGFTIIEAISFRHHPVQEYVCRNQIGTLLTLSSIDRSPERPLLLCETDMLFVRPVYYPNRLSGEHYPYLDYSSMRISAVAMHWGISHRIPELNRTMQIGVPYLILTPHMRSLGSRWLAVLDSFKSLEWLDLMYAFGIAAAVDNLAFTTTHCMDTNQDQAQPLAGNLLHYCYGDATWNKRSYLRDRNPLLCQPLSPPPERESLLEEIERQIVEAGHFFTCAGFIKNV